MVTFIVIEYYIVFTFIYNQYETCLILLGRVCEVHQIEKPFDEFHRAERIQSHSNSVDRNNWWFTTSSR